MRRVWRGVFTCSCLLRSNPGDLYLSFLALVDPGMRVTARPSRIVGLKAGSRLGWHAHSLGTILLPPAPRRWEEWEREGREAQLALGIGHLLLLLLLREHMANAKASL